MNKGRSNFTSGGGRRQGTEVHEDRRTKRRRTRTDDERAAIFEDEDSDYFSELAEWILLKEEQDETANAVSFNRRTRR